MIILVSLSASSQMQVDQNNTVKRRACDSLKWQINIDSDQNVAAIDKTSDDDRLLDGDRLFSHICSMIF